MPPTLRHLLALLVLAAALSAAVGAAVGCGAGDDGGSGVVLPPGGDASVGPDFGPLPATDLDVQGPDADDDAPGDDVGPAPDAAETGLQSPEGKPDPDYLVPPEVAHRAHPALSDRWAAWVERDTPDGAPRLVAWDLQADDPPRALTVPNLIDPRDLALGDGWLFYVDVRYGDPDLFAVRLSTGALRTVVATQGAQDQPTARGSVVAWRDCRGCVEGAPQVGEIYRRDMSGGDAVRLTDDDVDDRAPTFGTLADGAPALAWLAGDQAVQVAGPDGASTVPLSRAAITLAFTEGFLAWRASPLIINPDSMHPGEILSTEVASGDTTALTSGALLEAGLPAGPVADAGRVAWIESLPATPAGRRLTVADPADGAVDLALEVAGMASPVLFGDRVAFLAPRDDNGGLQDLWVRDL